MALIDDLLRLFGTSRVRLRWKWDNWQKGARRRVEAAGDAVKPGKPIGYQPGGKSRLRRALSAFIPDEFPLVTVGNLILILVFFFATVKVSHDAAAASGESAGGLTPDTLQLIRFGGQWGFLLLREGEWWRLVTAIFLHWDLLHLILNAVALWVAGQAVEDLFGRGRTMVIWLVTGVAGFAVSLWWKGDLDTTVGASGSVFGLIGAVIGHVARYRGRTTQHLKDRFVPWLIFGVIWSFLPRVNGAAHVGGLAAGLVLGALMADARMARRLPDWMWRVAGIACVLAIVVAFWFAYRSPAAAQLAPLFREATP